MTDRSEQAAIDATYLESAGMSKVELSALHHFSLKNRSGTFNGVRRYFTPGKQLRRNNMRFAERLAYVARERRSGTGKSFGTLVQEALARFPL
jgi:hypothetical protein